MPMVLGPVWRNWVWWEAGRATYGNFGAPDSQKCSIRDVAACLHFAEIGVGRPGRDEITCSACGTLWPQHGNFMTCWCRPRRRCDGRPRILHSCCRRHRNWPRHWWCGWSRIRPWKTSRGYSFIAVRQTNCCAQFFKQLTKPRRRMMRPDMPVMQLGCARWFLTSKFFNVVAYGILFRSEPGKKHWNP